MLLPAMFLGDWFCMCRKVGQREVVGTPKVENSMAMTELGCENPSVEQILLF